MNRTCGLPRPRVTANANKVHTAVTASRATDLFGAEGYYGVFAGGYACGE